MNNNISYIQPFSIPMVQMQIGEDTSELKSCDLHTTSNLQMQEWRERHDPEFKRGKNIERHRILEKFPTTKNILENYVNQALCEIIGYKANFSITTSWITLTSKGSKSQIHSHKNSFWSGVYYFDDNYGDKSGRLTLRNPIFDLSNFLIETKKIDSATTPGLHIRPKSKCLVLFPSYVYHEIETHHEDDDRYSLAFNITPTGLYGDGDSTYDTNWIK